MKNKQENGAFSTVILPKNGWFDLHLKDVWKYRDLITLFVKRNFVSQYKQTILGPAWALIQPLLTTVVFTVVFGGLAGLAAEGVPSFYEWQYRMGIFFVLSYRDSKHVYRKLFHFRKSLFSTLGFADLNGPNESYLIFYSVFLFFDPSGDLLEQRGCSSVLVCLDASAAPATYGYVKSGRRHHHLVPYNKISRPENAGRLWRSTLDVWNACGV